MAQTIGGYTPEFLKQLAAEGLITIAPGALDGPTRGAVCEDCNQHMLEADGCVPSGFIVDSHDHKGWEPRIPYNNEVLENERETHRCHDCGCKLGAIHHFGCDMEVCPTCGGQAAFCGCVLGVALFPGTLNERRYFLQDADEEPSWDDIDGEE